MNAKDFLRLGVPLGEATWRATDFVAQYVLRGGDRGEMGEESKASSDRRTGKTRT